MKQLTALKVATYIANSDSADELSIFQDYLERHPSIKFYVGKLLNENDANLGNLLREGNEQLAEDFFESLKRGPQRKITYAPSHQMLALESAELIKRVSVSREKRNLSLEAIAFRREVKQYLDELTPTQIAEGLVDSTSEEIQFFYLEYLSNNPEKRKLVGTILKENAMQMGILFEK